jgi:hypothetical protein
MDYPSGDADKAHWRVETQGWKRAGQRGWIDTDEKELRGNR